MPATNGTQAPIRWHKADPHCHASQLPRTEKAANQNKAIQALARCLRPPTTPSESVKPMANEVRLDAQSLTVRGLWCPPTTVVDGVCHAHSLTLKGFRVHYGDQRGICLTGQTLTATIVRFRADQLRAKLAGLVPVVFSTRALPPLPLPYVRLDNVLATSVSLEAGEVDAGIMVIGVCPING